MFKHKVVVVTCLFLLAGLVMPQVVLGDNHIVMVLDEEQAPVEGVTIRIDVMVEDDPETWDSDGGDTDAAGIVVVDLDPDENAEEWIATVTFLPAEYRLADGQTNPSIIPYPYLSCYVAIELVR